MCGIWGALGLSGGDARANRREVLRLAKRIGHRGPDWFQCWAHEASGETFLCHTRLAIVGMDPSADQPMHSDYGQVHWIVNGEIYNHEALCTEHGLDRRTTSDSEVVGLLYMKYGPDFVHLLDGMFVYLVYDERDGTYCAGRDHMGICPMYWGRGEDGATFFSSEMKGLTQSPRVAEYGIFPPGHQATGRVGGPAPEFERWYRPAWETEILNRPLDLGEVRETVVKAVLKRLMVDVPHGVLLSGGLDSSLVTAITVKHGHEAENRLDFAEKLQTFSIGIEGAPDLAAARKVADHLGTEHHEFHFTAQEALDAVDDVVYHIESWHQIRASVPMFLLARKIKALGIKMVLSGEGADETLGGYLYFHKAPSPEEFHWETVRKTTRLHQWDVLRANKSTMAWGVEARVPFLDKAVLDLVMSVDPREKMCDLDSRPDGKHPKLEKYLLRKAFDTPEDPYLPEEVLWRQKEQFSDGVGYDWVEGLREHAEAEVSDEAFAARAERWPEDTPPTKEYYLLRSLFEARFPEPCASQTIPDGRSIACSTPEAVAWYPEWEKSVGDISGRAVDVHDASEGFEVAAADGNGGASAPRADGRAGLAGRTRASGARRPQGLARSGARASRTPAPAPTAAAAVARLGRACPRRGAR